MCRLGISHSSDAALREKCSGFLVRQCLVFAPLIPTHSALALGWAVIQLGPSDLALRTNHLRGGFLAALLLLHSQAKKPVRKS